MAPPSQPPQKVSGRPVLVVDDDETSVYTLRRQLERVGLRVITASSVSEAIAALHNDVFLLPSVVVCDILMPGPSGSSFVRHLRTSERFDDVALVLTSGVEQPRELPPRVSFFRKPVDWPRFIEHVLARAREAGRAPERTG
jgi:CheY-like chemotaxis protein